MPWIRCAVGNVYNFASGFMKCYDNLKTIEIAQNTPCDIQEHNM